MNEARLIHIRRVVQTGRKIFNSIDVLSGVDVIECYL